MFQLTLRDKFRAVLLVILIALASLAGCTDVKRLAYEGLNRDEWQEPGRVIRSLGLEPGNEVADLGSGSGYFSTFLADAVGPTGSVYAVDVDSAMNQSVENRARKEGYDNIIVILAEYDDPLLPSTGVDMIFTCNTYHHIEDRVKYFASARKYLRKGGRVAIIDYKPEGWFQNIFPHSTSTEVIRREMEAAGYHLSNEFDFLTDQSFLVFSLNAM